MSPSHQRREYAPHLFPDRQLDKSSLVNVNATNMKEEHITKEQEAGNGEAIASMVLGILGIFAWLIPIIGAPITIVGLILGVKGLKSSNRDMALAGVVMCIIGYVLTVINLSMEGHMVSMAILVITPSLTLPFLLRWRWPNRLWIGIVLSFISGLAQFYLPGGFPYFLSTVLAYLIFRLACKPFDSHIVPLLMADVFQALFMCYRFEKIRKQSQSVSKKGGVSYPSTIGDRDNLPNMLSGDRSEMTAPQPTKTSSDKIPVDLPKLVQSAKPSSFKKDNPAIFQLEHGNLKFSLTDEEKQAIQQMFDYFKKADEEFYVHPQYVDEMRKAVQSQALMSYAKEQIMASDLDCKKEDKQKLIEKAIAAIVKAYSFYPLPIYLYDLASFMEMSGNMEDAKNTFLHFLKSQADYRPTKIGEILSKSLGRDITYAIRDAEEKLQR
jgi:hypothetical protein